MHAENTASAFPFDIFLLLRHAYVQVYLTLFKDIFHCAALETVLRA